MLAPHEARYALDRLLEGGMDDTERERVGRELSDYIDNVGGENATLDIALRHATAERDRHFTDAAQKEQELHTLRGVVGQCKGEVADLTDATKRLCDLLARRPLTVDEADAVASVRAAMQGQHAHRYVATLTDSVRKFDALTIMRRMLHKLRVADEVRNAADDWARKQLRM